MNPMREFWERFRDRIDTAGGVLDFPDFRITGIEPVRRLKDGPTPPDQPPVQEQQP